LTGASVVPLRYDLTQFARTFVDEQIRPYYTPTSMITFDEWASRYPEWRRIQLAKALHEAPAMLRRGDAVVKNFVKQETSASLTDPRNISPRTDQFLATFGPFISTIEHAMVSVPWLVKGLNMDARETRMMRLFNFKRFIETDYSRFDMTLSADMIQQVEHSIFREIASLLGVDMTPELENCLALTLQTTGVSSSGIRYKILGTRCSGDAHTSIGNGLINRFNTWLCLRTLPDGSWDSIHEGDDGFIGVHEEYADAAVANLQFLECLGFSLKVKSTSVPHMVTFCGRHATMTANGVRTFCQPLRALGKLHTTISQGDALSLLVAKARSYQCTDGHTPIIGVWCTVVRQMYEHQAKAHLLNAEVQCHWDRSRFDHGFRLDVDESIRPEFELVSGISINEQLAAERYIRSWLDLGYIPDVAPFLRLEDGPVADDDKFIIDLDL
jgi:hypothetical protein